MWRALTVLLLGLFLILGPAQHLSAHGAFLYGTVSLTDRDLVVSVTDPYGTVIKDAKVTVATSKVDGKVPAGALMAQAPAGTYSGKLLPPDVNIYQITLELRVDNELFRGVTQVTSDDQLTEQVLPLVHVDQGGPIPWTAYLYVLLIFLLGIALAVAVRRKRMANQAKEEE